MIRICAWCDKKMGEKEPMEDRSETHGICDECLDVLKIEARLLTEAKAVGS